MADFCITACFKISNSIDYLKITLVRSLVLLNKFSLDKAACLIFRNKKIKKYYLVQ